MRAALILGSLTALFVFALACESGDEPVAGPFDADGDGISDEDEGSGSAVDTDSDGDPDFEDLDSDADGFPDADEAGDDLLATPPVDTDDDGVPDFRDPDSDGDGLSDADELAASTERTSPDTDGDGAGDLVEVAIGTGPLDEDDNPEAQGELAVLVPPLGESNVIAVPFTTNIQQADLYFLFDKSGGMQEEIDALRDSVVALVDALTCGPGDTPETSACVPDVETGVGQYHDPYNNLLSIQPDPVASRDALETLTSEASISREDFFEAITCMADGTCGTGCSAPIGCPGFRTASVRAALVFTSEGSDAGTLEAASAAMRDAGIKFAGVWNGLDDLERGDIEALATALGDFRPDGTTPRVLDAVDAAVATAASELIDEILFDAPLRVGLQAEDAPGDAVDATDFIESLQTNTSGTDACTAVSLVEDADLDGAPDTFPMLAAGTPVCWDLAARANPTLTPADVPQAFAADLRVAGDESPLDEQRVWFVVPPVIEIPSSN